MELDEQQKQNGQENNEEIEIKSFISRNELFLKRLKFFFYFLLFFMLGFLTAVLQTKLK